MSGATTVEGVTGKGVSTSGIERTPSCRENFVCLRNSHHASLLACWRGDGRR